MTQLLLLCRLPRWEGPSHHQILHEFFICQEKRAESLMLERLSSKNSSAFWVVQPSWEERRFDLGRREGSRRTMERDPHESRSLPPRSRRDICLVHTCFEGLWRNIDPNETRVMEQDGWFAMVLITWKGGADVGLWVMWMTFWVGCLGLYWLKKTLATLTETYGTFSCRSY